MKRCVSLSLFLLASIISQAQNPIQLDCNNKTVVLETLFDGKANSLNEVVWTPDFNERFNFNTSDDGRCYTRIDTILYYQNSYNEKFTVYIFSTNSKHHGEYDSYHHDAPDISVAAFSQSSFTGSALYAFKKHLTRNGDHGITGPVKLVNYGKNRYGFLLYDFDLTMGMEYSGLRVYDLDRPDFNEIFSLKTEISNSPGEAKKKKVYGFSSKIRFLHTGKEYDDIEVSSTGTDLNDKKEIVPVIKKRIFRYDKYASHYDTKLQ